MAERHDGMGALRRVLGAWGLQLSVAGPVLSAPLLGLPWWEGEGALLPHFLVPSVLLTVAGLLVHRRYGGGGEGSLSLQEGALAVVAAWAAVALVSALPFMTTVGLGFPQALFESVSGWTTTGLSVVTVEAMPRLVLMYRSTLQLAGGAGVAVLLLVASGGPMGPGLAAAEGREDRLAPHLARSARLVAVLYGGYAVVGTLGLWLAGMGPFDAVNHAFAAVSTGGFSTSTDSIGHWDSVGIEGVTILLMVVGSLNFQTAFLLLVRRRLSTVAQDAEVRLAAVALPVFAVLFLVFVAGDVVAGTGRAVRLAVFETVSALTTTGFSTTSYAALPGLGLILLLPLMLVGGATGSTAGGMKQYRVHVALEAVVTELRLAASPHGTVIEPSVARGDGQVNLDEGVRLRTLSFVVLYLTVFLAGSICLTGFGYGVRDALFEFASALGTVGLSVGVTSSTTPDGALLVLTAGMFLGRLELVAVLVALGQALTGCRSWWRHRRGLRFPADAASATGSRG